MTEILVEMLAELSLAQLQIVLHSAKKAKVVRKNLTLMTEQTAQHMSDSSHSKSIQETSQLVKANPCFKNAICPQVSN